MALILMRGFETQSMNDVSAYSGSSIDTTRRRTGTGALYGGTTGSTSDFSLPTAKSEFYMQFGMYIQGLNTTHVLKYMKGTAVLGTIRFDATNKCLNLYSGDGSTLKATGTKFITQYVWYLVELYVKIDDSAGVVTLRVDGIQDATWSGDTKPSTDADVDKLRFTSSGYTVYDDIVVNDTTGSINNSWPGGQKIYAVKPNGAGNSTQLTASGGSNYQCVDEVPPSSSDYVYGNSNGLLDLYALESIDAAVSTVFGISVHNYALKTGAPAVSNIKNAIRIGSTDYKSSNKALSTSQTLLEELWEINPNSSAQWTTGNINDLEAGVELAT